MSRGAFVDISPLKMRQLRRRKTSGTNFRVTQSHETSLTQLRKSKKTRRLDTH